MLFTTSPDFHFNTALTTVNMAKVMQLNDESKTPIFHERL